MTASGHWVLFPVYRFQTLIWVVDISLYGEVNLPYGADRGELGRGYPAVTLKLNNFSFLIFGQTP